MVHSVATGSDETTWLKVHAIQRWGTDYLSLSCAEFESILDKKCVSVPFLFLLI